jgi:hypothetical protein
MARLLRCLRSDFVESYYKGGCKPTINQIPHSRSSCNIAGGLVFGEHKIQITDHSAHHTGSEASIRDYQGARGKQRDYKGRRRGLGSPWTLSRRITPSTVYIPTLPTRLVTTSTSSGRSMSGSRYIAANVGVSRNPTPNSFNAVISYQPSSNTLSTRIDIQNTCLLLKPPRARAALRP